MLSALTALLSHCILLTVNSTATQLYPMIELVPSAPANDEALTIAGKLETCSPVTYGLPLSAYASPASFLTQVTPSPTYPALHEQRYPVSTLLVQVAYSLQLLFSFFLHSFLPM